PGGDPAAEPVRPGSAPDGAGHRHVDGHECLDWCPICRGAELLRAAVPPELHDQFQTVQRDMLLMAQALIEAHLERMGRSSGGAGAAAGGHPDPVSDETLHDRHFTVDEAEAELPALRRLLQKLRDAKDMLTDAEAHQALATAAPTNGGGQHGTQVGESFLEVR